MPLPEMEGIVKPTPDPTVLTTEASDRAKSASDHVERLRDDALQRELRLRQQQRVTEVEHLNHMISGSSKHDRQLFKAELRVIREQLKAEHRIQNLIEDQRKERKEDDRRALDAALAAAEKARVADTQTTERANTKTELNTAEQLKLQQAQANVANQGTVALLGQIQTRVERIENVKQGAAEQVDQSQARQGNIGLWLSLAAVIILGLLGFMSTVLGMAVTYVLTRSR